MWSCAKTAHLEILPIVCKYLSLEFGSSTAKVVIECVMELRLSNSKVICCHPNYQGEGEWSDWILHHCCNSWRTLNNKSCVFQPKYYNRQSPGKVVLMIVSISDQRLEHPLLVVQTCREQDDDSINFDSILLTCFAKKYDSSGSPSFSHFPISEIINQVFVIKDFVELFENKEDRMEMVLEGHSLPVCWYHPNENDLIFRNDTLNMSGINRRKRKAREKVHESLAEDWVYIVSPYSKWASKFSQID